MLGWEFPPFISGGLGTACYGLTRALDAQGHEVTFVLPRPVDGSHASHVRLVSPEAVRPAAAAAARAAYSPLAAPLFLEAGRTPVSGAGEERLLTEEADRLMREAGLSVVVLEQGHGVGGTWYWNRYPGARCDIESIQYSHKYLPDLEQEWDWSERYAPQPEILDYANEIADRTDVRRDMCFGRKVTSARWDEAAKRWTLTCDTGETVTAPFYIMATGCLSVPNEVRFEGRDSFEGPTYQTGLWPHEEVRFDGMRVGVIGTGSSAIQSIPQIARQAADLTIFQRTPNYAVPANNFELEDAYRQAVKADYPALRDRQSKAFAGADFNVAVQRRAELQAGFHRHHVDAGLAFPHRRVRHQRGAGPTGQGKQRRLAAGEEGALVVMVGRQRRGQSEPFAVEGGEPEVQMGGERYRRAHAVGQGVEITHRAPGEAHAERFPAAHPAGSSGPRRGCPGRQSPPPGPCRRSRGVP